MNKTLSLKIGVAVLALGLAGFCLSLATRIYDPLWSPFRPGPEKVLADMAKAAQNIKTFHYKGMFSVEAKEALQKLFSLSLNFEGDADNTYTENQKSAGAFNMKIGFEGMEFSVSAETKMIDKTIYLKLNEVPFLSMLGMWGMPFEELKSQWIKIETEEEAEEQDELTEKIQDILKDRRFLLVKKELPDEKVGGKKAYHYLVILDKAQIKSIILELADETMPVEGYGWFEPLTEEEKEKREKELDDLLGKLGDIEFNVWIDKKTLFLQKLSLQKEINMDVFSPGEKGRLNLAFEIESSAFNVPVQIEAPKDAKSFEELFPSTKYSPETEFEYYPEDYPNAEDWYGSEMEEYPSMGPEPIFPLNSWELGGVANLFNVFNGVILGR